ncbi:DUF5819 family protein [Streptomyces sp. NPDC086787]|uniref:DUF5819 family protein n=1 Tax=Streptomyces sp. NPDC086787 TaxID=3365759 RepID=UPI00382ED64A
MDAYGKDSEAPHGPDGSGVARPPGAAPAASDTAGDTAGDRTGENRPEAHGPSGGSGPSDGSGPLDGSWPAPAVAAAPAVDSPAGPVGSADAPRAEEEPAGPGDTPRTGVAALSARYQVVAALALAVVAVTACAHLGMVFLHVAPSNTVTKQHGEAIDEWIYPEFEQNWKLFAPNPLQQNIAVEARAQVRMADGSTQTTGWNDLSAADGAAIDGNPLPSHTQQNELRRAWDYFSATHDAQDRAVGMRGSLSEQYLRRIVVMRLYREDGTSREGTVRSVQVRSRTTSVPPPRWSRERVSDTPSYRQLPWWTVSADEAARGVR